MKRYIAILLCMAVAAGAAPHRLPAHAGEGGCGKEGYGKDDRAGNDF